MAKYLKQNQIKAGMTIFVVHPKFRNIEEKFIVERPRKNNVGGLEAVKFKYHPINHYTILGGGKGIEQKSNSYYRDLFKRPVLIEGARDGYCGDDGIPRKDGKFEYRQERRAFPTFNKALAYWNSQQTEENLARWRREDEENCWYDDF